MPKVQCFVENLIENQLSIKDMYICILRQIDKFVDRNRSYFDAKEAVYQELLFSKLIFIIICCL